MPQQKGKSGLFAKLGKKLEEAHEAHKGDETKLSEFGELPPGIENGVAQLVDCKFTQIKEGKQNAGEYMFYAAGVVKTPQEVGDIKVEGLRTQISEPLFDTPTRTRKSVDEHVDFVYNELRKLGVNTAELSYDDLETTVAALKEVKPHFRFRTWKGDKQTTGQYKDREPRVQHQWNGTVEFSENGEAGAGVEDHTGDAGEASASGADGADEVDIAALVKLADKNNDEAQETLNTMAIEAGVEQEEIDGAKSWKDVAEMIAAKTAEGGDGESGDAGEGEWTPEKGSTVNFHPLDAKTKKPGKKAVECEVTSVDAKKKTVALKNLNDPKKTYKDVAFDDVTPTD